MDDLRFACRVLWKDKVFSAAAILTLVVCIGGNTALFAVVDHVLLRPLGIPEADRVLMVYNSYPKAGADHASASAPDYLDRLRDTTVFEEQALFNLRDPGIDVGGRVERIHVMQVTPSFFRLVRTPPRFGRGFKEEEGEVGKNDAVILSDALWHSLFAARPDIVGQNVRVDGRVVTIVGVMPAEFLFIDARVQAWVPLAITDEQKTARHSNNWAYLARLRPDASLAQAQSQIDAISAANFDLIPEGRQVLANTGFHSIAVRLQDDLVRDVRPTLYLLWGGATFVLLIGCTNVSSLVLARSRTRLREFATRMALGAGRTRIAGQLAIEHLILTVVAGLGGVLVGFGALRLLGSLNIEDFPRGAEIVMDGTVVAYALGVAVVIGLVLSAAPLVNRRFTNLTEVLREEGRSGSSSRGGRAVRRGLVVMQVAFAFVLLTGAGLLMASFRQVLMVDPGFDPAHVLTASVALPGARYADDASVRRFAEEALRALRSVPGVRIAGATSSIPLGNSFNQSVIFAEGYDLRPGESLIAPYQSTVTPGYFEAMGVRLSGGRFFDERDGPDSKKVVIVDERLARRFWAGRDPIGRRMYSPSDMNNVTAITPRTMWFEVVGVVPEMKLRGLVEGVGAVGAYYFPQAQNPSRALTFTLRTTMPPTSLGGLVRAEVTRLDGELAVFEIQAMTDRTVRSLVTRRSPMLVAIAYGVVALFLSAIGIYGVLAYLVTQRTKEIGIRLALGSTPRAVFQLVLQEGALLVAIGMTLGALGAAALSTSLQAQLFSVRATDPLVLALTVATLAMVAFAACAVPARRATRIDPVAALAE